MSTIPDITIIGGGAIGLLTAREFFNAGASVTVIEKNELGKESSWAGGGILLPLYPWHQADAISRLAVQSLSLYPKLASQLHADTQIDPEWEPCGLLMTKNPDMEMALNWCKQHKITCQKPDSSFFNQLNTQGDNPLWLPEIAQIRNPRLIRSLKQDLINKGVRLLEGCDLKEVKFNKHGISELVTNLGRFPVKHLVFATGAWTGQLFKQFFSDISSDPFTTPSPKIFPVKGQMLLFQASPCALPHIVLEDEYYLIPRRDGKILVGSSVELDDFNKTPSAEFRQKLNDFALTIFPSLKRCPLIKHWAGLRPGTEHGIPYICTHPEIPNLCINAGQYRNGLVMGPASAQLLVDLVLNRPTSVPPEPYQLIRQ